MTPISQLSANHFMKGRIALPVPDRVHETQYKIGSVSKPCRSPCLSLCKRHVCFVLLLGLPGCATMQGCDPRHDPGFFGSINCHGSGAYTQRIDTQKQSVTAALADKDAMLKELRGTETTSNQLDTEIQQAEAELDDMDRQLQTLQSSLKHTQGGNSALVAKVSGMQKKIGVLRTEAKRGNPNKKELENMLVRD